MSNDKDRSARANLRMLRWMMFSLSQSSALGRLVENQNARKAWFSAPRSNFLLQTLPKDRSHAGGKHDVNGSDPTTILARKGE